MDGILCRMEPIFVRPLSLEEQAALKIGLRSPNAFTLRRCQILLASADHQKPSRIAKGIRCSTQTVRNTIRDFEERGLECLQKGDSTPVTVQPVLTAEKREQMRTILRQSPRNFGKPSSIWTLKLLAEVCHEQGLSDTRLSPPTILDAIVRLDVNWKRAKHWIVSPDPQYELKKSSASG